MQIFTQYRLTDEFWAGELDAEENEDASPGVEYFILTEDGLPILTEAGTPLLTEASP